MSRFIQHAVNHGIILSDFCLAGFSAFVLVQGDCFSVLTQLMHTFAGLIPTITFDRNSHLVLPVTLCFGYLKMSLRAGHRDDWNCSYKTLLFNQSVCLCLVN